MWFLGVGCVMFRMWNVGDMGCWGCGLLGMWDVRDVECSGCGMFAGTWDVDLQNATTENIRLTGYFRDKILQPQK